MDATNNFQLAEAQLAKQDPQLGALIARQSPLAIRTPGQYFPALCRAIIGQQVSAAAAATIYARFESTTGLQPQRVARLTDAQTKAIGLSRQKRAYLSDLAEHFAAQPDLYNHLEQCSDDEVVRQLTAVKGIGVWTAQMFLIFTLQRPDVFAPDDIGLQRAMARLYDWEGMPDRDRLLCTSERWRPYRSLACRHLWRSLHNEPT